jgi:hypothetical protein
MKSTDNKQCLVAPLLTLGLVIVFLFVPVIPVSSGTTLEALDVDFPDPCRAPFTKDVSECYYCHTPSTGHNSTTLQMQPLMENTKEYREIVSFDLNGKIGAMVPIGAVNAGDPLIQIVKIRGQAFQYQYGYTFNKGPFVLMESIWLPGTMNHVFFEQHGGGILPSLDEPGKYIFSIDLLYKNDPSLAGVSGWQRVLLFWEVDVKDNAG